MRAGGLSRNNTQSQAGQTETKGVTHLHPRALEARAVREVKSSLPVLEIILPLSLVPKNTGEKYKNSSNSLSRPCTRKDRVRSGNIKETKLDRTSTIPQNVARDGHRGFSGLFSISFLASLFGLLNYIYTRTRYTRTSQDRDTVASLDPSNSRQPPELRVNLQAIHQQGFPHTYQHYEGQGHRNFSGPFSRSIFAPSFGRINFPPTYQYDARQTPQLLRTVLKILPSTVPRAALRIDKNIRSPAKQGHHSFSGPFSRYFFPSFFGLLYQKEHDIPHTHR